MPIREVMDKIKQSDSAQDSQASPGDSVGRRGGVWGTGAGPVPHNDRPAGSPVAALSEQKVLLDSRDVSRLLGLGRTKVFEMMARSELPVIRIGRCVRVPRDALMDWISNETRLPMGTRGNWH